MIELLRWADGKRWRLLTVKGAQAHVVRAPALQLDVLPHHVHHIGARQQVLDERLGYGHGYIVREAQAVMRTLTRRQTNSAVQPNHLTVQHVVFDDVLGQFGVQEHFWNQHC